METSPQHHFHLLLNYPHLQLKKKIYINHRDIVHGENSTHLQTTIQLRWSTRKKKVLGNAELIISTGYLVI